MDMLKLKTVSRKIRRFLYGEIVMLERCESQVGILAMWTSNEITVCRFRIRIKKLFRASMS